MLQKITQNYQEFRILQTQQKSQTEIFGKFIE